MNQHTNPIQRKDAETQRRKERRSLNIFAPLHLCVELSWLTFILHILFHLAPIHGTETTHSTQTLTFQQFTENADLSALDLREVSIRGFLYHFNDQHILAPEPNLKSCCVGASHTNHRQITVSGLPNHIELPTNAVVLRGTFTIDGNHHYALINTTIEQRSHESSLLWLLAIGSCLTLITLILLYYPRNFILTLRAVFSNDAQDKNHK